MAGSEFDEFFRAHFDPVARAIAITTGSRELAADVTQEAFTKAYARWRRVRRMDRPDAWVYVVAMNQARRRLARESRAVAADPLPAADPVGGVATILSVRQAIESLPPREREAVVLRFLADLPLVDVAAAMDCAVGTVKATLHHALRSLRVEFEEIDDEG
jgi:DNA-directed RNA polymerase specialized sigma24 family protein